MFTTAGAVSRVAVGSETQSKGTYATAAIEFESPLENRELLQSMEGMNVPGGHPAGLKFIDWDTKKHFKLFGKKQRAAVETAGRSAAVVDLADASPGSDQNRDEDSPEAAAADGDATGWAAVEPEPEPDIPVSVRLAREEETRAAQLAAERANAEEAKDAEDDLISLGGDESDHFDDDAGEDQDATDRSVTPEPPAGDDDDAKEEDKDKEPPARYAAYESGAKEEDKDEDEETDDDKEDRRPSYKNRARSRSASRDNNAGHPSGRQPQSQRDGPPGRQRFSNGGDWGAPASGRPVAAAVTWSRCAAVDRRRPGAISAIGEIPEVRPRCPAARRPSALVGTTAVDAGDAVDPRTALEGIPRVRPLATSAAIGTHTVTGGALRPGQNEIVSPPNEIDSHPPAAAIACVGHPRRVAQPRRRRPAPIATPRLPWTRPPRFSSPDPRSTSCAASAPTAPGRARARTWTAHSKPCAKHAAPSSASGSGAAGTRLASSRVARRRPSPTPTPTKDRRTPSSDSSTNATKSWNARIRWGSYPTARRRARSGARTSTRAATGACRRRGSATSRR